MTAVQIQSQEDAPLSTAGPFDCPVRWDEEMDEPYIPFRAPRYDGELRLTPWRDEDRPDIVCGLTIPGRPFMKR